MLRIMITYTNAENGVVHEPTYNVASAIELMDRLLRLKCRRISSLGIYVKCRGKGNWHDLGATWFSGGGARSVAVSRLADPEYLEELAVRFYEAGRLKRGGWRP